jgi:hypothetical protein
MAPGCFLANRAAPLPWRPAKFAPNTKISSIDAASHVVAVAPADPTGLGRGDDAIRPAQGLRSEMQIASLLANHCQHSRLGSPHNLTGRLTSRLRVACRAKADTHSHARHRLPVSSVHTAHWAIWRGGPYMAGGKHPFASRSSVMACYSLTSSDVVLWFTTTLFHGSRRMGPD